MSTPQGSAAADGSMPPEEEFDQAMAAGNAKLARAKYGTMTHRLAFRLSTVDHKAYRKLEEGAQAFAGVNGTAVIKRAIRFYNAHLLAIADDDSAMAQEAIELRRGTYADSTKG
jgi:hypothetical protein